MNIIIIGQGKMGQKLKETLSPNHSVLAMADKLCPEVMLESLDAADMIIDFSHPDNCEWVLETMEKTGRKIPYLVGTTSLSEKDMERLRKYAEVAPVFYDSNYSLGIALLKSLAAQAAKSLEGFDIEIIEKHHNQKQDAPSGTALSLLEAVNPDQHETVYGRKGWTGARGNEIGMHSIRGGTLAGTHEIEFLGPQENLILTHEAADRQIFVNGAVRAAEFLKEQEPGFYSMSDLIEF